MHAAMKRGTYIMFFFLNYYKYNAVFDIIIRTNVATFFMVHE